MKRKFPVLVLRGRRVSNGPLLPGSTHESCSYLPFKILIKSILYLTICKKYITLSQGHITFKGCVHGLMGVLKAHKVASGHDEPKLKSGSRTWRCDMNIAQKRVWYTFGISAATLVISVVVSAYLRLNEISTGDMSNPAPLIIIGILCAIPLILIVALSILFPGREYDERDLLIERKANTIGIVGVFVFLTGAGYFLPAFTKIAIPIVWLIYFAAFFWFLVSSVVALIQYGLNRMESGDAGE